MGTRVDRRMERYDLNTNKMLICGVGQVPTDCGVQMSKRYFAPRLGIAYRASSGFVVRAGYGITYDPFSVVRNLLQNTQSLQALILNAPARFRRQFPEDRVLRLCPASTSATASLTCRYPMAW